MSETNLQPPIEVETIDRPPNEEELAQIQAVYPETIPPGTTTPARSEEEQAAKKAETLARIPEDAHARQRAI